MKALIIAASALLLATPSLAVQPRAIAQIDTYYLDGFRTNPVGETIFYCDGGTSTTGFVSSEFESQFFECP